jgi:hypothetical protein
VKEKFAKGRERPRLWLPRAAGALVVPALCLGSTEGEPDQQQISSRYRTDLLLIRTGSRSLTSEESVMSKFKIEKGVSRINRVKLQASIEESVAAELVLMCEWSNNDRNYVVNELLRFALSQDGEFQAYKESADVSGGGRAQAPTGSARLQTAVTAKTQPAVTESASGARQLGERNG